MKRTMLLSSLIALPLLLILMGCGGASLNSGGNRNLEQVEPDFIDPVWYDDYEADPKAAYKRFKGKVLQLDMSVTDFEETAGGVEVTGTTGEEGRYRISCMFPVSASNSTQSVRIGDYIAVKGLFDHMQQTARTYQIYLKNCARVTG